jgi:hypothetical protein
VTYLVKMIVIGTNAERFATHLHIRLYTYTRIHSLCRYPPDQTLPCLVVLVQVLGLLVTSQNLTLTEGQSMIENVNIKTVYRDQLQTGLDIMDLNRSGKVLRTA